MIWRGQIEFVYLGINKDKNMTNKYAVKQLIFERRKAFREANKKPSNKIFGTLFIGWLLYLLFKI